MMGRSARLAGAGLAFALALAGAAEAQSALPSVSTSAAGFNAGWGRAFGQENQPVDLADRMTSLSASGLLPRTATATTPALSGAVSLATGAASGGASLVPSNTMVVLTQGNWRTTVAGGRAQASAEASADASVDLNGKIDIDGPY
jgi:hypothetical protein